MEYSPVRRTCRPKKKQEVSIPVTRTLGRQERGIEQLIERINNQGVK